MNKEESKVYYREYYQKHREKLREYSRKRQSLRREVNRQLNKSGGIKDTRELKKCIICKQFLPLSSFSHNRVTWDGLEAYCRGCNVIKARQWRQKNKSRMNEIVYASAARYPDKCRARSLAHQYYPERQECIIKNCKELGERHHPNYNNGKEIIWLCKKHHTLLYHNNRNTLAKSVI